MALDADLVARMDASCVDYWTAYALAEGGALRDWPGAVLMTTPIPISLFNSVFLTRPNLTSAEEARRAAADTVKATGTPVLWRISANAATGEIMEHLRAAGLTPSPPQPAMLKDLAGFSRPALPEGLSVETAGNRQDRYDWSWLTCDAFGLSPDVRHSMSLCEAGIPEDRFPDQPRYTGVVGGARVAVSSLVMTGEIAGIYAVATLPDARRRGIGAAMTLHAVAEGAARGARFAVLQATDMGKPVYERIGFRTVFSYETLVQT